MTVDKHTDLDTVGEVLLEMDARDRGCPSQGPTPWIGMENLIREKSVQRHVMGDEHESKMFQGKRILAFIVAFETFSLLIHYYVFSHLFYLFDVKTDGWFWIFIIVLSVLWLLAMGFGMWHASPATNVFHVVSSLWLGLLFMFMFTLIGWDVVRQFVSPDRELVAATVVAIALGAMIYGLMNARFLRIKEHVLSTDKIEGEVRIAHLSDIHIGSVYGPSYLRKVVDRTNSLDPDMVLITGDLADGAFDYNDDTFRALDGLKAPTYYVTGNHEHYAGLTQVLGSLSATKVHHLVNDMVIEKGIQLIGVDYWAERDRPRRGEVHHRHVPRAQGAGRRQGEERRPDAVGSHPWGPVLPLHVVRQAGLEEAQGPLRPRVGPPVRLQRHRDLGTAHPHRYQQPGGTPPHQGQGTRHRFLSLSGPPSGVSRP
jgi:hypothetical protein